MNSKLLSTERGKDKHQVVGPVQHSVQACVLMHWSAVRAPSQGLCDGFYCPDTCKRSSPVSRGV